jgi:hypothetical protein
MVNFGEMWNEIVSVLKANSEFLQVPETKIEKGEPNKEQQVNPPSVLVYCIPINDTINSSRERSIYAKAIVFIECATPTLVNYADSLINTMNLVGRVMTALKDFKNLSEDSSYNPEFINATNNYIAVSIPFIANYDPYIE